MTPVIQEEATGCGIAASAAIAGVSYAHARKVAAGLGIVAADESLWSDTGSVRRLLCELGYTTAAGEKPFAGWSALPDCALLAIKWHEVRGTPYWHWVVFVREDDRAYVLDSKKALKSNVRTDFGRMRPRWSIEIQL